MARFIPGCLLISACLSNSMWAGLVMPGRGNERECHKLFGTSVRIKCRPPPFLVTCHHYCTINVKGRGPGRDKCLREMFQCRAEGDARKGIVGVWRTVNALVVVQVVWKFIAVNTEVARTEFEGHPREPGGRGIVVVAGGDSNVVVLMTWKEVAKPADFEFVQDGEAMLAKSAERGGE